MESATDGNLHRTHLLFFKGHLGTMEQRDGNLITEVEILYALRLSRRKRERGRKNERVIERMSDRERERERERWR